MFLYITQKESEYTHENPMPNPRMNNADPKLLALRPLTKRRKSFLCAGVSACGLLVMSVSTHAANSASAPRPFTTAQNIAPGKSARIAPSPPANSSRTTENIVIKGLANTLHGYQPGGGLIHEQDGVKAVSTVDRDFMDKQVPMATAFQLASLLPGANVATSDPFGFSPSTDISVRGLGGDSIGYVLEGMPLNDVAYSSGYPGQFADSENYQEIALAQGSSDLDSPVLNAAGGLMQLTFRNPAKKAGGFASASYGSYNTNREFIRMDTGDIAHTGLRGFVSYSHGATDNWRGPGRDEKQHVDFKFLKEWGQGNHASLLGSFNSTITSYYPQVSMESWKSDGIGGSNNLLARYDASDQNKGANYWRLWRQPERTLYAGAPVHLRLTDRLTLDSTPYAQFAYGNAPGGTVLSESGLYQGTQALPDTLNLPGAQNGEAVVRANYTQRSYAPGLLLPCIIKRHGTTLSSATGTTTAMITNSSLLPQCRPMAPQLTSGQKTRTARFISLTVKNC